MKTRFGWALASAMLLGGIGSASAADMAVKAMPPPAPIWNWTGFYIGGSAGGIWNDTDTNNFPTGCFLTSNICGNGLVAGVNAQRSDTSHLGQSRFIGGGQAGYNYQSGRFVGGIEGDISWTGINQIVVTSKALAAPLAGSYVHSEGMKQDWLATIRARAGFTVTPNFLLYATGGLAFARVQLAGATGFTATPDLYLGGYDDTRFGWTVGGGGEWMIAPKWSIKAEYMYVDLGKQGVSQACITPGVCGPGAIVAGPAGAPAVVPAPGGTYQSDFRIHEHIARVGLNYHFGGPVVAKY